MSLIEVSVVVVVVLVAVLVGTAVPALLQLRSTLKSLDTLLNETRPRLNAVLDQAAEATSRVNRAAVALEEGMGRVRGVLNALESLGTVLETARDAVRKTVTVATSIGPALYAGYRTFFASKDAEPSSAAEGGSAEASEASGPASKSEEAL